MTFSFEKKPADHRNLKKSTENMTAFGAITVFCNQWFIVADAIFGGCKVGSNNTAE